MSVIVLALPEGVEKASFVIRAESMVELATEVEALLADCDHDEYTATMSNLRAIRKPWKPGEAAVWSPWSCDITLKRRL